VVELQLNAKTFLYYSFMIWLLTENRIEISLYNKNYINEF
jgi:hypothetical protein